MTSSFSSSCRVQNSFQLHGGRFRASSKLQIKLGNSFGFCRELIVPAHPNSEECLYSLGADPNANQSGLL